MTGEEYISIYSRGWHLTHYLAFEPSRRGQVTRYLQGIQRGERPLDSAKAAFGDLKKLDRELAKYLGRKTLPVQAIPAAQITTGPIALRPLSPGETASIGIRMRTDAQPTEGQARFIAGDARGVVRKFPNDPVPLTALAAAEFRAKHYKESLAAADRAIAADPKSLKALVFKGRSLMEQAKKNPAAADWTAIRGWFAKANRLDPDAAEPLMLFFQSYVEQGARPTATAVEGMLYALEMAPFDRDLRLMAVRQLLADGKIPAGRAAFGPIAYNPHAGKSARPNLEIMAKIAAGDTASASPCSTRTRRKDARTIKRRLAGAAESTMAASARRA
jgi:tetratricopeptide (TPR) repeat protein